MPTARPSTAAIMGRVTLGRRWMNFCEGAASCEPSLARRTKSLMSLPALNTPPEPMKTWTAMASLFSAASSAADMTSYMGPVSAFFLSARRRRMICTPLSTVDLDFLGHVASSLGQSCVLPAFGHYRPLRAHGRRLSRAIAQARPRPELVEGRAPDSKRASTGSARRRRAGQAAAAAPGIGITAVSRRPPAPRPGSGRSAP